MKIGRDGTVAREYRVRAVPAQKNQYPQERRFVHYNGEPGDRPPARIAFDTTMPAGQGTTISYR